MNNFLDQIAVFVKLLVKRGANLNMKDRNQEETALSQSVYFGHEENARLLIREGADVNLCDKRLGIYLCPLSCFQSSKLDT